MRLAQDFIGSRRLLRAMPKASPSARRLARTAAGKVLATEELFDMRYILSKKPKNKYICLLGLVASVTDLAGLSWNEGDGLGNSSALLLSSVRQRVGVDFDAFQRFARTYRRDFARISSHTACEYSAEDVEGEALVLALEMAEQNGQVPDFDDPVIQDRLVRFLYQRLVRYAERTVRFAVKLDKPIDGLDISPDEHPAMLRRMGRCDVEQDPLSLLLAKEEDATAPVLPSAHESRAAAYLHLLDRCGNRMKSLAALLRISLSYCYFRFNEAKELVAIQLNLKPDLDGCVFTPGPWRPFQLKVSPQWIQLPLDFKTPRLC